MKSYILKFSALLLVFALAGCEGYLDINQNPNRSTEAEPAFLFTEAITGYSTNRTIDFGTPALAFSQIQAPGTFGVFVNPARYTISPFTNGNTWSAMYSTTLVNLSEAIRIAEAAEPANLNASGQAKVFSALAYYTLTMIWEDVPFTESLQPQEFPTPQFDSQEDVLNGIIALLDEAIAQMDVSNPQGMGSNDLIYGSDIGNWIKFANSLKFRTLMVMADADPSVRDQIVGMLDNADMIASQEETALFPFFNESGNFNPIWRILDTYTGRDNICYFGSEATINLMKGLNDPRLDVYFTPGPAADSLIPVEAGGAGSIPESARMTWGDEAPALVRPDQPDLLFTYAEQLLLEAEAELRFANDAAAADQKMRDGVTASMTYYGVDPADIDAYLAAVPDLSGLSTEDAWVAIAQQQWIDFIERPLEAWTNWRRSGVPSLELPFDAPTSDIMRRFRYPVDEGNANPNTPTQQELDVKMWFEN